MPEEKKSTEINNKEQSKAIQDTIRTNPLKHAVAPKKELLGEAIEMGEKLKNTWPDQVSVVLDKFENTLAKKRKPILE